MLPLLFALILFFVSWLVLNVAEPLVRGGLSRTAHFTTKFRYRDYLPVFVVVGLGAGAAAFFGDQFIDLAELVVRQSPMLQEIDHKAHDFAVFERTPGWTTFFAFMSVVGGPVVLGGIAGIVTILLVVKGRFRWAAFLLVTTGGGALINLELKRYFARARPDIAEMLRRAHGYSFPSGHAMGSTVVFGALSYLAFRTAVRWRWKTAWLALAATLVLAVALSRVYLGVHCISDVGAGIAAGSLWVAMTTVAYETVRRIRRLRQRPVNLSSMRDGTRGA